MTTCTIEFDEDRGGGRDPANLLSSPTEEAFYKSTKRAMEWTPRGQTDAGQHVTPSVFVENLFAPATVTDVDGIEGFTLPTRCLDAPWLQKAVNRLMEEGLCVDDSGKIIEYDDYDALVRAAWKLVRSMLDDEALQITQDSFEWLDPRTRSRYGRK